MIWLASCSIEPVSTHSRAEAAAFAGQHGVGQLYGFNTQPRGGGGIQSGLILTQTWMVSTHSRAEAAAPYIKKQEKSAD